jgi:hypothetical protein
VFKTAQLLNLLNCVLNRLLLEDGAYACLALHICRTPLVRPSSFIFDMDPVT